MSAFPWVKPVQSASRRVSICRNELRFSDFPRPSEIHYLYTPTRVTTNVRTAVGDAGRLANERAIQWLATSQSHLVGGWFAQSHACFQFPPFAPPKVMGAKTGPPAPLPCDTSTRRTPRL